MSFCQEEIITIPNRNRVGRVGVSQVTQQPNRWLQYVCASLCMHIYAHVGLVRQFLPCLIGQHPAEQCSVEQQSSVPRSEQLMQGKQRSCQLPLLMCSDLLRGSSILFWLSANLKLSECWNEKKKRILKCFYSQAHPWV